MESLFHYCYKLKNINLSNFDLSKVTVQENIKGMFDSTWVLNEIKTPKVMSSVAVTLPRTLYDSNGNAHTELTSSSSTQTLLKSNWT